MKAYKTPDYRTWDDKEFLSTPLGPPAFLVMEVWWDRLSETLKTDGLSCALVEAITPWRFRVWMS